MAKHLVRGEKVLIGEVGGSIGPLAIQLSYPTSRAQFTDVDIFVFPEDASGKVEKKNILYYGNPECYSGNLRYEEQYDESCHKKTVRVNLNSIPEGINKLIMGAAIHYKQGLSPTALEEKVRMTVTDTLRQSELFDFETSLMPDQVESMLVGEIYKYNGSWKLHVDGVSDDDTLMTLMRKLFSIGFK